MTPKRGQLAPRREPQQQRARETVELILDTTGELLDEVGVDGFTTNLLAERAGIRVSTIYRYYPNKFAAIVALAERMAVEWDEWFESWQPLADPDRDLWQTYESLIDRFAKRIRVQPGGIAVRRAMQASPELRDVEREDNDRLAENFADALRRRGVGMSRARLRAVGRMLLDTAAAMHDELLVRDDPSARASFRELKEMHRVYLASLLDT